MISFGTGAFSKKSHKPPKWIGPLLVIFFVLLLGLLWLKKHN